MARIGMNPARKAKTSYRPADVSVGMLTFIPSLGGYFKHRLDVLNLSIASLLANTSVPFDFFVLDNGSCPEVVDVLRNYHDQGKIDFLILSSRNLGVEGGVRVLANNVLGKYFAFTNDDVFFYPGWLKEHLEIINAYPNAGMVSGTPVGFSSENADKSLQAFLTQDVQGLEVTNRSRQEEWERDWARSTGRDIEDHLQTAKDHPHTLLNYRGVKAINSATHFQFVSPREVIPKVLPRIWRQNLMDGMVEMDHEVDALGLLRLSTPERVTRHIGNFIDEGLRKEAQKLGLRIGKTPEGQRKKHWLLSIPGSGRLFRALYQWLFDVLHGAD